MPKSNYGKWSVGSIFAMLALFFISALLTNYVNETIPDANTIYAFTISRSILDILIRGGYAAGISALLNGLIGIFNHKDRGLLIYTSTIFGAAVTMYFILGQFIPQLGFVY